MTANSGLQPNDSVESSVFWAGPSATESFYHVLGIPTSLRNAGIFKIGELAWFCGVLRIDLLGKDFGRCVLKLFACDDALHQGLVRVAVDGSVSDLHPHVHRLFDSASKRLAKIQLRSLLDLIRKDPLTRESTSQFDQARAGENANPKPYAHEWQGPPDCMGMWGMFFDDLVYVFTPLTRVNFISPITHIFHGNHECLCVTPKIPTRTAWAFHYAHRLDHPVAARVRGRLGLPNQKQAQPFKRLSTDLNEFDTIMGTDPKLSRVVELAVNGDSEKILSFHKSCLPKVMGDDVDRHLRLARQTPHVHCLSQSMGHTHDVSLYAEELQFGDEECGVLRDLLLPPRTHKADPIPGEARFDLVGFPDGRDTDELVVILESCGASLNALLLPDVDVPVCRATAKPNLQIRYPNAYFQGIYDTVFDHLAPRVLQPAVPYGLQKSEQWLLDVGQALNLDQDKLAALTQELKLGLQKRWTLLGEIAPKMRLGFVVDPKLWPRLVEPSRNFGLSIPEMLFEMGFGIDLLAYAPQGDCSYARSALEWPNTRVREFPDEPSMHVLLSDPDLNAVYSDHRFEGRLGKNGKSQFGLPDFEMGFQGALRSFERLVRACQLPFYKRYANYMLGASA